MTELITNDILDEFKELTKYDIEAFFDKYVDFIDQHYAQLVRYFSGGSDITPMESLNLLSNLIKEHKRLIDVITLNASVLLNYEYWAVTEYVEDIGTTLETSNNLSRWLRASSTNAGYKNKVRTEVMTSQGETLEDVEYKKLGSSQPKESWIDTAMENQIAEEDYDSSGGVLIKAILKNNSAIVLNGIVDNIDTPEKTYGIDIDRVIAWVDDDLRVLDYKDTIFQCADVLSSLKQGDDPSFPERGLSKAFVGSNIAGITYPSIFRQLSGNFATDDSFKSIAVIDVKREQDAVSIEIQLETKAGAAFEKQVQL